MSFAHYKSLLKDEDGSFKVDWILVTSNLLGVAIVIAAAIQARASGPVAELGSDIINASLF